MALDDIAGTQGVVPNAYDTSLVVTLRKSITALEVGGYDPAALILSPADWEAVELLLSTTNSIEHMSLPFDSATRRLFSVPVVTTNAQAEGTAHTSPAALSAWTPTPSASASNGPKRPTPTTGRRT